jgi:hypothetical protein
MSPAVSTGTDALAGLPPDEGLAPARRLDALQADHRRRTRHQPRIRRRRAEAARQRKDHAGDQEVQPTLRGPLAKRADDALAYFPVPDKKLQKTWSVTLKGIARQGRICQDAMTPGDDDPHTTQADRARFNQALDEIFDSLDSLDTVLEKITKVATSTT